MNFLNIARILPLLLIVLLSACNKDNLDEIVAEDPVYQPDSTQVNPLIKSMQPNPEDGLDLGCITIQYPFDLLLESGMTVTINSTSEFEAAADEDAPDPVVDFVFPLNVTDTEDNLTQVNNNVELGTSFASCIPDDGWDDTTGSDGSFTIPAFLFEDLCFDLVYPVDVKDPDDNTYTANNETELIDLIATTPGLSFILPITVLDEEGNEHIIESVAGFYDLYYSCEGISPPGTEGGIVIDLSELDSTDCNFETLAIQFPYDVETEDGELITVENENQEAALILSGVHYTVLYPFNMVDADGEVITINDETEFILLILPCLITIEESETCDTPAHILLYFNQGSCGTVMYPNQLTAEGVVYDITSFDDYLDLYNMYSNQIDAIDVVYPISVTTPDGTLWTFNSDEEVCSFIDNECG